ncbi:unnamed protein product [Sphagnum jensenii]|uniref:Uncharacterized protein n=1 Tax=Sphagnum jensenii TaxID=128206 RepID=A0ABP1BXJ9_9BRYO
MENLDKLVMILKNCPSDMRTSYCSLAIGGMMIEEEPLDDFENELKDARSNSSTKEKVSAESTPLHSATFKYVFNGRQGVNDHALQHKTQAQLD